MAASRAAVPCRPFRLRRPAAAGAAGGYDYRDGKVLLHFGNNIQNLDDALSAAGLAPWAASRDVCLWGGVACLAGTRRVASISLPNLSLRGAPWLLLKSACPQRLTRASAPVLGHAVQLRPSLRMRRACCTARERRPACPAQTPPSCRRAHSPRAGSLSGRAAVALGPLPCVTRRLCRATALTPRRAGSLSKRVAVALGPLSCVTRQRCHATAPALRAGSLDARAAVALGPLCHLSVTRNG